MAGKLGVKAPIAIRVNPDVDAHTHAKITTGTSANKFGIPLKQAAAAYEAASKYPNITIKGVQSHIGSQITQVTPFVETLEKLAPLAAELKRKYGISYISIGGGIGVVYKDALASGPFTWWETMPEGKRPLTPEAYGAALAPALRDLGLKVLLEPGRSMVANAGVLLSRVEYLKRGQGKNFLILDAAMNDLVRPAMYDSYHEIVPLRRDTTRRALVADVVGPDLREHGLLREGPPDPGARRGGIPRAHERGGLRPRDVEPLQRAARSRPRSSSRAAPSSW